MHTVRSFALLALTLCLSLVFATSAMAQLEYGTPYQVATPEQTREALAQGVFTPRQAKLIEEQLAAREASEEATITGSSRIVGGTSATPGYYPFIAALLLAPGDGYVYQICGASVIDDNWILTAAHCTEEDPASSFVIGTDSYILTSGLTQTAVAQKVEHPSWNTDTYDNDISLLRTSSTVSATPVSLVPQGDPANLTAVGTMATVIGWGATSEGGSSSNTLLQVQVPIVSQATANAAYGGQINANMLPAGYSAGGKDSCQGDSGGPFLVPAAGGAGFVQAGVVSWGYGCARPNYYGIYTRLSQYATWISSQTGITIDGGGGGDTSGTAIPIPHLTGADTTWDDFLQVNNVSSASATFTLTLYSGGSAVYTNTFTVAGRSYAIYNLKGFAAADCGIVSSSSDGLKFRASFVHDNGGVAEFNLTSETFAKTAHLFANGFAFIGWKGLALMNAGTTNASVTLYAIGNGTILGSYSTTIAPKYRMVGYHSTFFPGLTTASVQKIVAVSSSSSMSGIAISGASDNSSLLFGTAVDAAAF